MPGNWCKADSKIEPDIRPKQRDAPVAQGIEHRIPNPCAAGSNPAGGTINDNK